MNNRWLAIFLTVIFISAIAVGAYWLGTQKVVAPIPTTDSTAGWKTYTNIKNKYSFLYPKEWFITDRLLHTGGENLDIAIESNRKDELVILVQPEGFGMSPQEGGISNSIKVDGLNGMENISTDLITLRVEKGNTWHLISYKFDVSRRTESIAIFDQILATFKFLP